MKPCSKCKNTLPDESFYTKTRGAQSWCKRCHRADSSARKQRYQELGLCVTGCKRPLKQGNTKHCVEHSAFAMSLIQERKLAGRCAATRTCDQPADGNYCLYHNELKRWARIKREYGLTQEAYEAKLRVQDGRCPITGDILLPVASKEGTDNFNRAAVVDHCHTTLRTRDILSNRANVLLGLLNEDPELISVVLANMLAYLDKWKVDRVAA